MGIIKPFVLTAIFLPPLLSACQDHPQTSTLCTALSVPFAHTVCTFQPAPKNTKLYWQDPTGEPFYKFDKLIQHTGDLSFAMNAGMYDDNFAPIGYTVIDGTTIKKLNLNDGQGNFHLLPNGVFWWDDDGFYVDESHAFATKLSQGTRPKYATQSGPMLVIQGQIHPKFDPKSTSTKIRNGVGVDCTDGQIYFIISDEPVNFYGFADVFKGFGCQNALFLDGGVASALYAKKYRHDKLNMAVMIAITD